MNAVVVDGLTRRFGDFSAVRDVSFSIPQREIAVLVRTTNENPEIVRALRARGLPVEIVGLTGLLHQPEVVDVLSVLAILEDVTANPAMLRLLTGVRWRVGERDLALLGQRAADLGRLWQGAAEIDRSDPEAVLRAALDEATAGVDPVARREFWDLIYRLAGEGVSVLATTHYMDEADYCNTIGMMYEGELVALASPEALKERLPGVLVQIDCDRPAQAADLLAGLPWARNASVHGALVHLTLGDAADLPRARQALAAAGHAVSSCEVIQPSLEDVFIAMVHERQAAGPVNPNDRRLA